MGKIRQTKRSCNGQWTDILYHNTSDLTPGSSLALAVELIQDQSPVEQQTITVQEGVPFWVKWTVLYNDQMDFYYCATGLYSLSNDKSNYVVYQPDGTTLIDLTTSNTYSLPEGSGPDPLTRETQEIFINYSFQSGQTYYLSFIPVISGSVGIYIGGD